MNIMRACADWRIVAVLAAAGVAVALIAPNLIAAAIPLLIVAACPIAMLVMMRTLAGHQSTPSQGSDLQADDRQTHKTA
jgi:DUF2933 family protein